MAKIVNTLRWREKGREEEESLKMSHIVPKMFATDACVKVPLFNAASPLRHSVAYVMTEGRSHHTKSAGLCILVFCGQGAWCSSTSLSASSVYFT